MPAHQNIIVLIRHEPGLVRKLFTSLLPIVEEWLGPIRIVSVQDYLVGSKKDRTIEGAFNVELLPDGRDHETVVLYPSDHPKHGCVLVYHEGSYDAVTLSLVKHVSLTDQLVRLWDIVRAEAIAVLVGDELEVGASQIDRLLQSDELPDDLDLCELAIVRNPTLPLHDLQTTVWQGGRLLMRNHVR